MMDNNKHINITYTSKQKLDATISLSEAVRNICKLEIINVLEICSDNCNIKPTLMYGINNTVSYSTAHISEIPIIYEDQYEIVVVSDLLLDIDVENWSDFFSDLRRVSKVAIYFWYPYLNPENKAREYRFHSFYNQVLGEITDIFNGHLLPENKKNTLDLDAETIMFYDMYGLKHHYNESYSLKQKLEDITIARNALLNSFSWKITYPLRIFRAKVIPKKQVSSNKENADAITETNIDYLNRAILSEETQTKQREIKFAKDIKFSILVPLYDTPLSYLVEMIESVVCQTYPNWELCLADGTPEKNEKLFNLCTSYSENEPRIIYRKLDKNYGISENTNKCIELATGNYIGLLDHDDILHPAALFEVMKAIESENADFIYTDEATFEHNLSNLVHGHLKPDFSPDNLRANNYICHFTCFSRELLDQAGWFRPEYDGSQDFDIFLRLTEKATKIVHIPELLYFWRVHIKSVAGDISAKPYCLEAAINCVDSHLQRVGLSGKAELISTHAAIARIKYDLKKTFLISIIIVINEDTPEQALPCIRSILKVSSYQNYEIIIVGSEDNRYLFSRVEGNVNIRFESYIVHESKYCIPALNNLGAKKASGNYLIFLSSLTQIITPEWMEEMLMYAQRDDVGAVGANLLYPDKTIAHAGMAIGKKHVFENVFYKYPSKFPGYMRRLTYSQNYLAVTSNCMMLSRENFNNAKGFDEEYNSCYFDVDLCLKLFTVGKSNVFTPYAKLCLYQFEHNNDETKEMFINKADDTDENLLKSKWKSIIDNHDPYFNSYLWLI